MPPKASDADDDELAADFRLLGAITNPTRLKILGLLYTRRRSTVELARETGEKLSVVGRHIAKLREAGLLVDQGRTDRSEICIDEPAITARLTAFQAAVRRLTNTIPRKRPRSGDARVLSSFVKDGRLISIPAVLAKKRVVLRWVVERFEETRRYPEREVNKILGAVHPDFASLRRELIDHGYMRRAEGHYWRT